MSSTRATKQTNNESRFVKFQKKNNRDVIASLKIGGDESARGQGGAGSESETGGAPSLIPNISKITELGDITSPLVIDFQIHSDRVLNGNVDGNTTITFKNIPVLLLTTMRLYIRSVDPVITIDGTIISGVGSSPLITTAVGDFLDISLSSTDQVNVTVGTTKKNDKTEEAPGLPQNVQAIGNSPTTINVIWNPPLTGTQPITYDVAFSLTSGGDATNGPTTHASGSPDNDIASNEYEITGLVSATNYYVWIRAKNAEGNSDWLGPFQTNTDGISNPSGVNFAIPGGGILWNKVTVNFDAVAGAFYTLTRTNTVSGEVEILQDNDATAGPVVDDTGIIPETDYDYKIVVKNGFGAVIGTATINVDTPTIDAPTVVFAHVGTKLKWTVTLPANINLAFIEWALDDSVDVDGFFDTGAIANRQISRPIGTTGETDVVFETGILLADTLYYSHVKLQKNEFEGAFTSIDEETTGTVSPPSKPGIVVTSPATGEVRIKLDYNDAGSTGEWIVVSYRISSETGPYTPFETYFRDNPPADDLDVSEDEIEVIRDGFTPSETFTFRAEAFNQSGASTGGADTDNVLVDA